MKPATTNTRGVRHPRLPHPHRKLTLTAPLPTMLFKGHLGFWSAARGTSRDLVWLDPVRAAALMQLSEAPQSPADLAGAIGAPYDAEFAAMIADFIRTGIVGEPIESDEGEEPVRRFFHPEVDEQVVCYHVEAEALDAAALQVIALGIERSGLLGENVLSDAFAGTRGFGIKFRHDALGTLVGWLPWARPYFERVLHESVARRFDAAHDAPRPNAHYFNVLIVPPGSGTGLHVDRTLDAHIPASHVSVLYVKTVPPPGGQLHLNHRAWPVAIVSPRPGMLVHFRGDLEHGVSSTTSSAGQRISLVCEHYVLPDDVLAQCPYLEVITDVRGVAPRLRDPMKHEDASVTEALYRGFACPYEPFNNGLLEFVVTEHARAVCRAFLDRFSMDVSTSSQGLSSLISAWSASRTSFEEVWTLGTGRIRASLRDESDRAGRVHAAAQFGFDLLASGLPGNWSVRPVPEDRLRWGRWLLPAAEKLTVTSDGRTARVTASQNGSRQVVRLWRKGGVWCAEHADALPSATFGRRAITVLMPRALTNAADADVRARLLHDEQPDAIIDALDRAAACLRDSTPRYLTWVGRVVRGIIPLRSDNEMYLSGSYADRPGVVTCSFPTPPEMLCELLVHEASHQYFNILTKLGDVDDGSDSTLYYSPARRMERPLVFILLAYHAVGNMLLFWRAWRRGGVSVPDHCRPREAELEDWARQLEAPLHTTGALTGLGHALWKPLSRRLQETAA